MVYLFQKRYGKVKESHTDTVQESEVIEQDVLSAVKGILADYDIDVPDYAVVVGNPARVVKMLDAEKFQ